MTARRSLRRTLGSAVAVLLMAILAVAPASSSSLTTYRAVYYYGGSEASHDVAFERPTSFSPIALAQTLTWNYSWIFTCGATASFYNDAQGSTLRCNASNGNVWGEYHDKFSFPNLGTDCDAVYSKAPNAVLSLGGALIDTKGQELRITVFSPQNGPVLIATPTCGYPPGNIVFGSGIGTLGTVHLPDASGAVLPVSAYGVLTGFSGYVKFHSDFMVNVTSSSFASNALPTDLLRVWSDQVSQWIGDRIDSLRPTSATTFNGGSQIPFLESFTKGEAWVTATADDPIPLFSVHFPMTANVPTPLPATIPASALRELAAASGPVRLHLHVRFQPDHGAPTSYSATTVADLSPTIRSVSFSGSPAAPTITLHGAGLGTVPPPNPATLSGTAGCPVETGQTGLDYGANLSVTDVTGGWGAGRDVMGLETDCIGIVPVHTSPTAVTLRLGSFYSSDGKFALRAGDKVQVVMSGAVITVHVRYGATVSS